MTTPSTSFLVPFQLTPQGTVATTTDPNVIATQRVQCLIGTPTGARVMQPDYGVNIPQFMFSSDLQADINDVTNEITTALQTWEPTITVIEIDVDTSQSQIGYDNITVDFTQAGDINYNPTLTASVLAGGTVVENTASVLASGTVVSN